MSLRFTKGLGSAAVDTDRWQAVAASLAELGGFFSWQTTTDDLVPLATALQEPELSRRFAGLREGLADAAAIATHEVDARMAVSAVQVGLVSRLWSVSLASALLHDWVPELRTDLLVCGEGHRNPVPMASVQPTRGRRVSGRDEITVALSDLVLQASVTDVDQACGDVGATSHQVLTSNTASALVGAARVLRSKRPAAAEGADAVVRAVLLDPRLAMGGGYTEDGEFKRRGCCLYYRLPGHGLCPDCVLVRPGRPAGDH